MKRLLPPLILLLFLGFVVWRVAEEPRRQMSRDRIDASIGRAMNASEGMEDLLGQLDVYLAQNPHNMEDRLFVAETLLRVDEGGRAIDTLWGAAEFRERSGAGRELAGMLLESAALLGEDPEGGPEFGANLATVILAEGGHPAAEARLTEIIQTAPWQVFRTAYYATLLFGGETIRETVIEDLRSRGEPQADTLAAILAMRPDDYPNREADLEQLLGVFQGNHRKEHRPVWSVAAIALGRSGAPEAQELLREAAEKLGASDEVPDREDGTFAALGVVAGGDWTAWDQVRPFLTSRQLNPMLMQWAIHVLAFRWQEGDEAALEPIQALWRDGPREGAHRPRLRLAFDLFLRDPLPDVGDPVDRLAADLEAEDATPGERLQGASIRLRRKQEGARDELVAGARVRLHDTMIPVDVGLVDPLVYSLLIHSLRSLYLYDR